MGAGASGADLAEVLRLTAEAVTQCKFEATDPAADEVVLFKILQVRYTLGSPFTPTLTALRARRSPRLWLPTMSLSMPDSLRCEIRSAFW